MLLKYKPEDQIKLEINDIVVNDKRHKHYKETVDIAKYWRSIVCGDNQECIILKQTINRNEKQEEQRVKLYNTHTPYLSARFKNSFLKVDRCDSINTKIDIDKTTSKEKVSALDARIENFNGTQSVDKYLDMIAYDQAAIEANSWLLVDFHPFDPKTEIAISYPLIISPEEALFPKIEFGTLQYIVFKKKTKAIRNRIEEDVDIIWAYTPNKSYFYVLHDKSFTLADYPEAEILSIEGANKTKKSYWFQEFNHSSGFVPAHSLGYNKSVKHKYDINESILFPTKHLMDEYVGKKSIYDNQMTLYGFIRAYFLTPQCDHREDGFSCNKGHIKCKDGSTKVCGSCRGSGHKPISKTHTNEQDIVTVEIPLPKGDIADSEIPDLSKFAHYIPIPKEALEMNRQELDFLSKAMSLAMFNANIFDRSEVIVPSTATEILNLMENMNNILDPYGKHKASLYEFVVKVIASNMALDDKVEVSRSYPSDYKMFTASEMIDLLKAAKEAGLPIDVINSIERDIRRRQHSDNEGMIKKLEALDRFRPFYNMSDADIATAIGNVPLDSDKMIKYLYWDEIVLEVELEHDKFEELPLKKRKEIIDGIVQGIREAQPTVSIEGELGAELEGEFATELESFAPSLGNKLAQSVGGSSIIGDIKKDVAQGISTREAGINQAMIQLGYDRDTAERLIAIPPTQTPNEDLV